MHSTNIRNLKVAIDAALKCPEKPHVQGCLVYTISPVHTNESFVELAVELEKMGCHSVCIKDMSGLLKPYVAEDLVKKAQGLQCRSPIDPSHALHIRIRSCDLPESDRGRC